MSLPALCHLLHLRKKTKRWRQAKEAHYHLLHLRKKNDDEPPGSSSSSTLKGKKQRDDNKPPSSSSSSTLEEGKKNDDKPRRLAFIYYIWEKNKQMTTNIMAHRHLLHLRKKKWQWAMRLVVIFYTWGKNQETCSLPTFFNYSFCVHKIYLKDEDESKGSLSSPITQEKPTSRFFFWVAKDDDEHYIRCHLLL
jgi:hypothetical protein